MKVLLGLMTSLVALPILAYAECPPLDPAAFWLPKDKLHAKELLIKKARKLNDSGKCVIDGSFGRSYNKFYISVSPTGTPSKEAKILRFSLDELKN